MKTPDSARHLLAATDQFQSKLVEQTRAAGKLRELLSFIVRCIEFAEKHLPSRIIEQWEEDHEALSVLSERLNPVFDFKAEEPTFAIRAANNTASVASSDVFSLITGSHNYIEGDDAREEYSTLAGLYFGIVTAEEKRENVYTFLSPLNSTAAQKFKDSTEQLSSIPPDEDPQGPLMGLRSALSLAITSLLEKANLSRSERNLKLASRLPVIAEHLAKNAEAKLDLILANEQFQDLWRKLSAAKNTTLSYEIAQALAIRTIAMLNLIAETISLESKDD
jgi:predicted XRE-type DNA-binding protein